MRPLARVLIDESHRQAWSTRPEVAAVMNPVNPADASYAVAAGAAQRSGLEVSVHAEGPLDDSALDGVDVLVLPHAADDAWEHTTGVGSPRLTGDELEAIDRFVHAGGGLVILAETEQAKYGNNVADLAARFGIAIDSTTVQDPTHAFKDVPTWVLGDLVRGPKHDLTAQVSQACFYRAGTLHGVAASDVLALETVARTSPSADPSAAALVMSSTLTAGRVVVTSDSDLFGDDSITDLDHRQLWLNLVTWAAGSRAALSQQAPARRTWTADDAAWTDLVDAVESLRPLQAKDGSVDLTATDAAAVTALVDRMCADVEALAPRFPHQSDHLAATVADLRAWADAGFGVPDFVDSLALFRPDLQRRRRRRAPRGVPDVHAERQPEPQRRGRRDAHVLARLAGRAGAHLRQRRVRPDRVRRLHPGLRHALGGVLP